MVLDADARILRRELVKGIGEALLVAAALRLYGEAQHRRREGDGLEMVLVLVVGVMQHGIEVQLVHLGDRADIARDRFRYLHGVLADELIYMCDLEWFARIAHEELGTGAHGALMDAQNTELADVW